MATKGRVRLSEIARMLDACAPGARIEQKLHRKWVIYNGKVFHGLPKGEHGKVDPEIEIGHIRKMVRFLEIDAECAAKSLPILGGKRRR